MFMEQVAAEICHIHSDNRIFSNGLLLLIVISSSRLSRFLESVLTIRMSLLSSQSKPSFIWPGPSWFIFLCTGASMVLRILHFGILLWNILFGFTIAMELLTKTKANHCDLLRTHVWGCPVHVLDPNLQDGQKISKWNCWTYLGQFLGFNVAHSSLVANVQHLFTVHMLPQHHLVIGDMFETLLSTGDDVLVDDIYNRHLDSDCNFYSIMTSPSLTSLLFLIASSCWCVAEWSWAWCLLLWPWRMTLPFWRLWTSNDMNIKMELGPSSASNFPMVLWSSLIPDFVFLEINGLNRLISLRHMLLLSNGLLLSWYLSLRTYLTWNQSKLMSVLLSFLLL